MYKNPTLHHSITPCAFWNSSADGPQPATHNPQPELSTANCRLGYWQTSQPVDRLNGRTD